MKEREINPEEEAAKEFLKQYFQFNDSWLVKNQPGLIEKEKEGYEATVENYRQDEQTRPIESTAFENTNNFWNYFRQRTIDDLKSKLASIKEEIECDDFYEDKLELDPYYGQTLYFWLKEAVLDLAFEQLGYTRSQQMIEDINFCNNPDNPVSPDLKSRTTRYKNSLQRLAVIMHDDLKIPFGLIHL
ncbi:MAG: hypothetical protein V1716_00865 [Candidatus Uhrbacteria bacterium]